MPLEVVHAQAIVKRCAALANFKIGKLDKEKCDLITKAADEVIGGLLDTHFPLLYGKLVLARKQI